MELPSPSVSGTYVPLSLVRGPSVSPSFPLHHVHTPG
jgi:hypothetical protein